MILAPRSCPSRPGFAITTLIFPAIVRQVYEGALCGPCGQGSGMKLTIVGCSPAWPNAGGGQSGYNVEGPGKLLLDCGPGVLARLRERDNWPQVDAIAITHFHLDHWGDLVPWVWGNVFGPGSDGERPELWLPPGGRGVLAQLGEQLGSRDMFEKAFRVAEYAERERFAAAGFDVLPLRVPHYDLLAFGFRCSSN